MAEKDGMQKMLPEAEVVRRSHRYRVQQLVARTPYSCNKLLLFVYSLLFLFVGIIVVAIGVLVKIHYQKVQSINNQLTAPVALLIIVGLIIIANATCGLVGTITENAFLLKVFLVITILAFILQLVIGIITFIYREKVPSIISHHIMFAVEGYGTDDDLSNAMDYLQIKYSCCGLNSYLDYSRINPDYKCSSGKPEACSVPKTCCKTQSARSQTACAYNIAGNVTNENYVNIHGCMESFIYWLAEHLDMTGAISLGFAIPQTIGILLAYFFIRRVSEYHISFQAGQY